MSAQHTGGPWWHEECYGEAEGTLAYEICSEDAQPIALVEMPFGDMAAYHGADHISAHNAAGLANACLIAAAPELLEALEAVVANSDRLQENGHRRRGPINELYEQSVRAIAKARGEQVPA